MKTALATLFSLVLATSAFAVDSAGDHDRDRDGQTPGTYQDRDARGAGADGQYPARSGGADARTVPGADTAPGTATDRQSEDERNDRQSYDVNGNNGEEDDDRRHR